MKKIREVMFEELFARKKLVPSWLCEYGFDISDNHYQYSTEIMEGAFTLLICVDADGNVDTVLTDKQSGEEYTLYKTNAEGAFVGKVREEIYNKLKDVSESCSRSSSFKSSQTLRVVKFAHDKYGDELQFLWDNLPDCAVLRRNDTNKWYAVFAAVPLCKLGFDSDNIVEIMDLHISSSEIGEILKHDYYYPGWHMNKRSWYTVILNDSVDDDELFDCIEKSYKLAIKR